jgi:hypothetical protein
MERHYILLLTIFSLGFSTIGYTQDLSVKDASTKYEQSDDFLYEEKLEDLTIQQSHVVYEEQRVESEEIQNQQAQEVNYQQYQNNDYIKNEEKVDNTEYEHQLNNG